MSKSVYSYGDIVISPYQFEKIIDFKLTRALNEHAKLSIKGVVPQENLDEYVENANSQETIEVQLKGDDGSTLLFKGTVTRLSVEAKGDVRSIAIEALSGTFLMDVKRKNRSFQDHAMTYGEIFKSLTKDYPHSDVIDKVTKGKAIGGLLVQYKETDWEFIKRLASYFNAPLIPDCRFNGAKFFVGLPQDLHKQSLDEYHYTIEKDLKGYRLKTENDLPGLNEQNLISYSIASHQLVELGSPVAFNRRTLFVYQAITEMENGLLTNRYVLRDKKGMGRRKITNVALAGVSLFGKVLDVAKDNLKIQLEIDGQQDKGKAMWFPYSTIYSSPDGSGWYCMPEVGDQIRVHFPDDDEKNAFAASSVNLSSSNPQKRSDPSVKSISTKYGKEIVFQKGAIEIIGNGKLLMRLTDDGGIEINSDKKIMLTAKEDIEITGGAKILLQGEGGVDLTQGDAALTILDEVTISGAKVKIE